MHKIFEVHTDKYKKKGAFKGFSLAEALISLLIIAVVVAMTTVMVGKNRKFQKKDGKQNYWSCTLDPVTGQHVMKSDNPALGKADGDSCIFIPPKNVSQFYVTVIGGGGGGAAGSSSSTRAEVREGFINFVPPVTGQYYILVIGPGGGGGGKNCGKDAAQGGGSGGVVAGSFELKSGVTYILKAGKGAAGGKSAKTGADAGDSSFVGGGLNLVAGGGHGGYGKYKKIFGCKKGAGEGKGGNYSGGPGSKGEDAPYGGDGIKPGYVCRAAACLVPGLAEKIGGNPDDITHSIGRGGYGASGDTGGGTGLPGLVKAVYSPIFSGWGGKSGVQSYYVYKRSPGETKVVIGKGGKGGIEDNEPGQPGQASRFGDRIIATGGAGGEPKFGNATLDDVNPKVIGGEGGNSSAPKNYEGLDFTVSPFGGFQSSNASNINGLKATAPGSGGGGGGADSSGFGTGADGTDGIVIVTW